MLPLNRPRIPLKMTKCKTFLTDYFTSGFSLIYFYSWFNSRRDLDAIVFFPDFYVFLLLVCRARVAWLKIVVILCKNKKKPHFVVADAVNGMTENWINRSCEWLIHTHKKIIKKKQNLIGKWFIWRLTGLYFLDENYKEDLCCSGKYEKIWSQTSGNHFSWGRKIPFSTIVLSLFCPFILIVLNSLALLFFLQ